MQKIILGSSSEFRKGLVRKYFREEVDSLSPDIDEKAIRRDDPSDLVKAIALAKAEALIPRLAGSNAVLITSDQVVVCEGVIREKPESEQMVRDYFKSYSDGSPASTVTGVVVTNLATGQQSVGVDIAQILFDPIPGDAVEGIIRKGEVFTSCGGLLIEEPLLVPFIKKIEGDSDSVIGLPIRMTKALMKEVGYTPME